MQKRKAETEMDAMAGETSMDTAACTDMAVPAVGMNGAMNGHEPAVVEEGEWPPAHLYKTNHCVVVKRGPACYILKDSQRKLRLPRLRGKGM